MESVKGPRSRRGYSRDTREIGETDGDFLIVVIRSWLAEKLRIAAGSVDSANGKFTTSRSPANHEGIHGAQTLPRHRRYATRRRFSSWRSQRLRWASFLARFRFI